MLGGVLFAFNVLMMVSASALLQSDNGFPTVSRATVSGLVPRASPFMNLLWLSVIGFAPDAECLAGATGSSLWACCCDGRAIVLIAERADRMELSMASLMMTEVSLLLDVVCVANPGMETLTFSVSKVV